MVIYISGKMAGNMLYYEQFARAERYIRKMYPASTIINPAKFDYMIAGTEKLNYKTYLLADLCLLAESDAVCMLDGWDGSAGARTEHSLARALDLTFIYLPPDWEDEAKILE